jgi:hypothetical protein
MAVCRGYHAVTRHAGLRTEGDMPRSLTVRMPRAPNSHCSTNFYKLDHKEMR